MEVVLGKEREQIIVDSLNACERDWTTDKENIFNPRKVDFSTKQDKEMGLLRFGESCGQIPIRKFCVRFLAHLGCGKLWEGDRRIKGKHSVPPINIDHNQ